MCRLAPVGASRLLGPAHSLPERKLKTIGDVAQCHSHWRFCIRNSLLFPSLSSIWGCNAANKVAVETELVAVHKPPVSCDKRQFA